MRRATVQPAYSTKILSIIPITQTTVQTALKIALYTTLTILYTTHNEHIFHHSKTKD